MENPLKILIVEDEPIIADDLAFMLEEMGYDDSTIVHSAEDALDLIKANIYDMILLDINLDGHKDGIDVAAHLHKIKMCPFIFLTSLSDEKTLIRVKKTYPAAYLVKPIDEKDLKVNIELSCSLFNENLVNVNKSYPSAFYVKDKTKMSKIIANEIIYLEGSNNYTIIHTDDKKYVLSQTLKLVQQSIDPEIFVRIHKSAIVNLERIEEIEDAHVKINNFRLPIGRTYRSDFLARLNTL